tara:strand:+ start:163 stop:2289 length:2127 start_codon:yes stop_codon:yes gene_type:complete
MSLEEFGSLQSNFVGRDGFRWWIGQIAPGEIRDTWGNRVRVRIMGYHPFSEKDLPNDKLPYATVLLGTTTGGGSVYQSHALRPGDVVFGFFLDGDSAQQPCVAGVFGRTTEQTVLAGNYKNPFEPYSGLKGTKMEPAHTRVATKTTEIKDGATLTTASDPSQTAENNEKAGPKLPANVPPEAKTPLTDNKGNGQVIKLANPCEDDPLAELTGALGNFMKALSQVGGALGNVQKQISKVLELIQDIGGNFVQNAVGALFGGLENILADGLDALFNTVFASTMAATGGNALVATAAGITAQKAQIPLVEAFQSALQCVGNKIVTGLKSAARNLLESLIDNALDATQCVVESFAGGFLADIVKQISDGLAGPLAALEKILGPAFTVIGFLQGAGNAFKSILSFLDCGQGAACPEVKEWTIGEGAGEGKSTSQGGTYKEGERKPNGSPAAAGEEKPSMFDNVTNALGQVDLLGSNTSSGNILRNVTNNPNLNIRESQGCYAGNPADLPCGRPQIEFIGGGGFGALAKAFVGNVIQDTPDLGNVFSNVSATAGIIGIQVENPGQGYVYPPIVKIKDQCRNGYGGVARATLNSSGGVESVYMISNGQGYTPGPDQGVLGVTGVQVVSGGEGYGDDTTVTDDQGNNYRVTIRNGQITSVTPESLNAVNDSPTLIVDGDGTGANLAALISDIIIDETGEVLFVKDCVGTPFEVLRV